MPKLHWKPARWNKRCARRRLRCMQICLSLEGVRKVRPDCYLTRMPLSGNRLVQLSACELVIVTAWNQLTRLGCDDLPRITSSAKSGAVISQAITSETSACEAGFMDYYTGVN